MINGLFELENIKYIISVDDCFIDTSVEELRDELYISALSSFEKVSLNFCNFGKQNEAEEIQMLLDLGQDASVIIRELIDSLSAEEIKECCSALDINKADVNEERVAITTFLKKLKSDGLIEKYATIASTHEAETYDTVAAGMTDGSILWLIDKSFTNAGESANAGLELAKNKVKNCTTHNNYVFMLTNINTASENEDDIAKEFDQLLAENGVEVPSFIYYISKSKIIALNLDRIAKSLAFGFKRKQCYILLNFYIECLQRSCNPTIDALRKIDQKSLDYVFSKKVEGNGESYFDFFARLVQIFHKKEYGALLTDKQEEIHRHIQLYQEICKKAPQEPGNLTHINETLAKVRQKELYDNDINARYSEISTGDIFQIQGQYYILVTQSCDTVLRKNGERTLKQAILLKIDESHGRKKFIYELSCFNEGEDTFRQPVVVFQDYKIVPFEILDLCSSTSDGSACIDITLFENPKPLSCIMSPNYINRYEIIRLMFSKIYQNKLVVEQHFDDSKSEDHREIAKEAYCYLSKLDNALQQYELKDTLMVFPFRRIARLTELITVELIKEYGNVLSRVGQPFDFMRTSSSDD